MSTKGQLVEIPADASLYAKIYPAFLSKKEELRWQSHFPDYGLFDGFLVGEHPGAEHFKLGQRKGINVGGKKAPLYVIGIDRGNNRIFVGEGRDHPGLWMKVLAFSAGLLHWSEGCIVSTEVPEEGIPVFIDSPSLEQPAEAKLYLFNTEVFLEANEQFPLTLADEELNVLQENTIIANIKNNNINSL